MNETLIKIIIIRINSKFESGHVSKIGQDLVYKVNIGINK